MTTRHPHPRTIARKNPSRNRSLPPLCSRFRVEVASGTDDPCIAANRSRALAVWMLERWREDRSAARKSDEAMPAVNALFTPSRADLN